MSCTKFYVGGAAPATYHSRENRQLLTSRHGRYAGSRSLQGVHSGCPRGYALPSRRNSRMSSLSVAASAQLPSGSDLKGILFDIDGTLADSDPLHLEVFQERLVAEGFVGGPQYQGRTNPIDDEFFTNHLCGRSDVDVLAELFPDCSEAEIARMAFEKDVIFQERAEKGSLKCVKGLENLLASVQSKGVRCVAVTNASRGNAEQMMQALQLPVEFVDVIIGSECKRPKPDPAPYQAGLRALGLEPHECFAVEDSPSGARAAVAAGIATVGVLTRQEAQVLKDAGVTLTIEDFNDEKLWKELGWDR